MGKAANLAAIGSVADTPLQFRNKLINGNFDFWQRGTSFGAASLNSVYTADRWACYNDGSGASNTVARQAFTVGQTDVPGEPQYFLRFTGNAATSQTYNILGQRIESVRTLAGQPVTISFYAKVASGTPTVTVRLAQHFGTGGSPSADVSNTMGTITLSTSWQRFVVTGTLPSISGKTIGSDGNDFLALYLFFANNTAITFDLARASVEQGITASPVFEDRPRQVELAMCQRYYQLSGHSYGLAFGTGTMSMNFAFPVTMRANPSATLINGTNAIVRMGGSAESVSSISAFVLRPNFSGINLTGSGYTVGGSYAALETGYVGFSAEL